MKRTFLFLTIFVLAITCAIPLSADTGPKPSITIYVENAPDCMYYLDLLVEEQQPYNNLSEEEQSSYDPEMLAILREYNKDGLRAALAYGTAVPLFGKLTGETESGRVKHYFSYFGVPDTVKVIAVTEDGTVYVSNTLKKTEYQAEYTLDFSTFALVCEGNSAIRYLSQFLSTFIPTVIIELIVLLLFGFSVKKNILSFLTVNFATQIILTIVYAFFYPSMGTFFINFAVLPFAELGVIAVEATAYAFLLKDKGKGRRVAYAIVANLCSWIGYSLLTALVPFVSELWL